MKKVILIFILIISILSGSMYIPVFGSNGEIINMAPSGEFLIENMKKVDVVILTDYTGTDLANLQTSITDMQQKALSNGVNLKVSLINDKIKYGTKTDTVTETNYIRYATLSGLVSYTNEYHPEWNYTNDSFYKSAVYEECWVDPYTPLPPFSHSLYWSVNITNYDEIWYLDWMQEHHWYTRYNFYDNYSGYVTSIELETHWETIIGYYPHNETHTYTNVQANVSNAWSRTANTRSVSHTNDVYGFDYSKLSTITKRSGSEMYVLLASNSTQTMAYTFGWGAGTYPLGNMRSDNLQAFVNGNEAHVYAVMDPSMRDVNYAQAAHNITWSSNSYKQDITLSQLVNTSPLEGKFYDRGEAENALNEIIGNSSSINTNTIDVVVATDYTGTKLDTVDSRLSSLKTALSANGYDMSYTIIDGNSKESIGTGTYTNCKPFAGYDGSLFLMTDGTVYGVGDNYNTSLGQPWGPYPTTPVKINNFSNVKDICVSYRKTIYVKNDGTLWASGQDAIGELHYPDGYGITHYEPVQIQLPPGETGIKKAVTSTYVTAILTNSGSVYFTGYNGYGQFGTGSQQGTYTPSTTWYKSWFSAGSVTDVYCGLSTAYVIANGKTYSSGFGYNGRDPAVSPYNFVEIPGLTNVVKIVAGSNNGAALKADGTVWVWGLNTAGQYGDGTTYTPPNPYSPRKVPGLSDIIDLSGTGENFIALDRNGNVYVWGSLPYYLSGKDDGASNIVASPLKISGLSNIVSVSMGRFHALAVNKYGDIYSWGLRHKGQLADGYYYGGNITRDMWSYVCRGPGKAPLISDKATGTYYTPDRTSIINAPLRPRSERYFVYLSDGTGDSLKEGYGNYYAFGALNGDLGDYLTTNGYSIFSCTPAANLDFQLSTPSINSKVQNISLRNFAKKSAMYGYYTDFEKVISRIGSRYRDMYQPPEDRKLYLIVNEDVANYLTIYDDFEADPLYSQSWFFDHDPDYFENGMGLAADAGKWLANPPNTFDKVGKYSFRYKVRDNPKDDARFDDYRLWSKESKTFDVYVHRRPVAQFSVSLRKSGTDFVPEVADMSFDLDHLSRQDKGIAATKWQWKLPGDVFWTDGSLPSPLAAGGQYVLKLEVRDIEGAWSYPHTALVDTSFVDLPPVVDADPQSYDGFAPLIVTVTADDQGENDFHSTIYEWSPTAVQPEVMGSISYDKVFQTSPPGDGAWYLHMKAYDVAGHSFYRCRGPYILNSLKITGVNITGYWNHWRGQKDIFGKQLKNEPHRFLGLERIKVTVDTSGYADKIVIRFSPELEAMQYKDVYGNIYDYAEDFFGYYVRFPQDSTILPDSSQKDQRTVWEYCLPLAPSTLDWNDERQRPQYRMTVTAWKGNASTVYTIDDIDLTGNIYDLTYIQPVVN